jgi:hypothetical protein
VTLLASLSELTFVIIGMALRTGLVCDIREFKLMHFLLSLYRHEFGGSDMTLTAF